MLYNYNESYKSPAHFEAARLIECLVDNETYNLNHFAIDNATLEVVSISAPGLTVNFITQEEIEALYAHDVQEHIQEEYGIFTKRHAKRA